MGCARNANGMIKDVSNTSSRLKPSMPTRYSAPTAGIHAWRSTNWSPAAVASKFRHNAKAHAAEMTLNIKAIGRPPPYGQVQTASAPMSGTKIIAVIKPTMRRGGATPAFRWLPRRDKFGFVPSAHWTSNGPNRAHRRSSHRLRH